MGDPAELRFGSYNIRAGLGQDLNRSAPRVQEAIRSLDADLVIVQEADFRRHPRRAALRPDDVVQSTGLIPLRCAPHADGIGWHGNAILAHPSINVQALHRIDLPGLEPRGAVIADLQRNSVDFRVVAVHLGLLGHSRRRQIDHILSELRGMADLPTIVAGDFNDWSSTASQRALGTGFRLAPTGRSFPTPWPIASLDRIALTHDIAVADTGVLRSRATAWASDHYPIWADLRIDPAHAAKRFTKK